MLKIRELNVNDLPEINKWRQDRDLIDLLGAPYRFIDLEIDEKWYENYLANRANSVRCVVVDSNEDNKPLCSVSLTNIDWINRSCIFQIMIGDKKNRKKGIGSFALKEMVKHAFNDLNLNRIELETLESNKAAQKFYEQHGFKQEGIKVDAVFKNGKYQNAIYMAILNKSH